MKLKELKDKMVISIADGGAVDNSAVAQLVRSLQLNKNDTGFNIVAFDNVTSIPYINGAPDVGIDIASLFGFPDPFCIDLKVTEYCINTPDLQVFVAASMYSGVKTWSYKTADGNQLIYTIYNVTTTDNPALGIKAGSRGTLHSFTCVFPTAPTAPTSGDTDFDAYDAMFEFINKGVTSEGGLIHLQTALGLL